MITEDERWREQFSDERNDNREGSRPYNRESSRSFGNSSNGEARPKRPRIQRSTSYEPARPQSTGYGQRREGGYQPYNREGGYQRREGGYNRDGYQQREGGYRPRREGSYSQNREGGYNHEGGYRREGGYNRDGYQQRQGGYGQQRRPYRPRTADYNPHAKYSMKKQIEYKEQNYDPNEPIRLNKFLANAGVCSRREADDFIQAGVVRVNGQVVTELGTKVLRTDNVLFHDQLITPERKVYVLLNKPKDTVTTSDDPQNRKTVMDLVKDACKERIYPVGRLDRNTTGVILLTNDGELASKLTHPQYKKKKIYHVFLDKNVSAADLHQIAEGIELEDGPIKADAIEYADEKDKKQVGIEIHSGRNRIVRRIFEHLGYKVTKLDRVYFAGLTKKNVRRGDWRFLTEAEVNMLRMGAFE
ncbi:MAG: RNA-binding S4 domain-containing protein [Bacteroidaceae bacterium]|nr:RNA-binding S4 domain-containing protein [Bacteroidaceae bacterium]